MTSAIQDRRPEAARWDPRDPLAGTFVSAVRLLYRRLPTRRGFLALCRAAAALTGPHYLFPVPLRDGSRLRVDPREVMVSDLILYGEWVQERQEADLVRDLLQPGSVFYDIGANVGWYSMVALSCLRGSGLICAFEPNPAAYRMLQASLAGFSNVRTFRTALADEDGDQILYVPAGGDMASLRPRADRSEQLSCRVARLADLVRKEQAPPPDLVKLDVEGAELKVIQGARELLSTPEAPVLLFEYPAITSAEFGYEAAELLDMIRALPCAGYQLYAFGESRTLSRLDAPPPGGMNLVAVPERRHELLRGSQWSVLSN